MDKRLLIKLAKARKDVREKLRGLTSEIASSQEMFETRFRPLTEPIKNLISEIKQEKPVVKKEEISIKKSPAVTSTLNYLSSSTPRSKLRQPSFLETEEISKHIPDEEIEPSVVEPSLSEIQRDIDKLSDTQAFLVGISRSSGGGKFQGQVVGISRSTGGGKFQGQVVGISRSTDGGNSKAKWWGYRGQLVGEIIKVKWWGYLGQVVGISRSSSGDIKVNWWGKLSRSSGGDIEVNWWGNSKAKWWGYRGQVVGISRSSGGDIKVRGRGLEVKVKKKWWGQRNSCGETVAANWASGETAGGESVAVKRLRRNVMHPSKMTC
ncbi:hypothetical protein GEV33_013903 [Tenebrio molitor]|uniref:Uncharacterized protein n=1 Tax=Tenebrio molitor TaxID=7067 RepID=A0A8J6H6C6_TENMO|nr:hypothetical protein GEV33_013903 [Tenebrio molitor]